MRDDYLCYTAFGGNLVDYRYSTVYNSSYRFKGKEKDDESGFHYYGARYYSGDDAMWLSVDPLADKYPHQSPYIYCSNNPVKLIDPDGMDEWEFDHKGKIVNRIVNTQKDAVHILGVDNQRIDGASMDFKYGTIKHREDKTSAGTNMTLLDVKGDDNAKSLFENFADNTSVEWTHAKIGSKNSGRNIIGTSHSESSTPVGHYLRNNEYTLREVNHNHPKGTIPSIVDMKNAILYHGQNKNTVLNVYTSIRNTYTEYNNKGYYINSGGEKLLISK